MEFRKIKNKLGEILKTKDGIELEELRFEVGDTFIPLYNKISKIERNDGDKKIINYSIKCKVKDEEGNIVNHHEKEEIFVSLTPAQAKSLQNKLDNKIEINQNLFIAYSYNSENYGKQIGLGIKKDNKPAKNFEDFE